MSVITISRGSFSHGKEVAEKLAARLGYQCIAREVLLEASQEYNISELKLSKAVFDSPSFLDRFLYRKEKYVAFIQSVVLRHLREDNVVYHGFAGHFFVRDVPHVLKVRIIADLEDRTKIVMERDDVTRREAQETLRHLDDQRSKWSRRLYGIDTQDPVSYDMVLHIHNLTADDVVEVIAHTAGLPRFRTTPGSQQRMEDLYLAALVKAALVEAHPDVEVEAEKGDVLVKLNGTLSARGEQDAERAKEIARKIPGVTDVRVEIRFTETY
ncbi:MAG: cytidylate kinase family protein [Proteobacteria bacterium]|nr:cytidylate kinase family protein [Pseudomonadota bacterium]